MSKVIISVINDLVSDQRVHRIASTLNENNHDVLVVGRKFRNSLSVENRPYATKRMRLLFNAGPLFYAEYNLRLFLLLLFSRADVLLANDLDTLLASYLVSRIRKVKLVFDSHEFFTELPELIDRNFARKIWSDIEKSILPQLKSCYTVCQSIADVYNNKYSANFKVIRNVPVRIKEDPIPISRKYIGVPDDYKVIVYQGALNVGRGLELVIKAVMEMEDVCLLIIGTGEIAKELTNYAKKLNCGNKVIFTGKISLDELPSYTVLGDVGFSLEEDRGLNYHYALPNKLFDYIQLHIPVLVSDLPEMRKVVKEYKVGEIVLDRRPHAIAQQLNGIIANSETYKDNLVKASEELCWENERGKLLTLFGSI